MERIDTDRIRSDLQQEAVQIAGRLADWLEWARTEGVDRLPEREELQRRLAEESEQLLERASAWAQTLPATLATRLGYEQPRRRRARTFFGILFAVGAGAALMYLFDPEKGAERRARLMGKAKEVVPAGSDGQSSNPTNASHSTPEYQG